MDVVNYLLPNAEQMAGFARSGPDGPIYLRKLLGATGCE